MPVFETPSSNILTTASVIELTDGMALPLHASARAAFEAWLCLPVAVRPSKPALPGLVIVAPDGPLGAPALVSGSQSATLQRETKTIVGAATGADDFQVVVRQGVVAQHRRVVGGQVQKGRPLTIGQNTASGHIGLSESRAAGVRKGTVQRTTEHQRIGPNVLRGK